MRNTIRELIDTTLRGVILDEGCAREFAEFAHQCEQQGAPAMAEDLRTAARTYRIKGMKGRAEVEVLSKRYASLLNQ